MSYRTQLERDGRACCFRPSLEVHMAAKSDRVIAALGKLGLLVHLTILLSMPWLGHRFADSVWERLQEGEYMAPFYEAWEADWATIVLLIAAIGYVYVPSLATTAIAVLVQRLRGKPIHWFGALGIPLCVFTLAFGGYVVHALL